MCSDIFSIQYDQRSNPSISHDGQTLPVSYAMHIVLFNELLQTRNTLRFMLGEFITPSPSNIINLVNHARGTPHAASRSSKCTLDSIPLNQSLVKVTTKLPRQRQA